MKSKEKDWLAILAYFIAAMVSLNIHSPSLPSHIFGVTFLIAGVYGIVTVTKNKKFIF